MPKMRAGKPRGARWLESVRRTRYTVAMPLHPRIAGLSPFGPIFAKELRTTARRKRSYFLRVLYLGSLLLILLAAWSADHRGYGGGVAAQQQRQAELGMIFFMCFSMFCVFAMALIGPVLTSTAISSERLHKTLPVLLMTPINTWQIIGGKLFSRLWVALTLIGLSLPVLALVRLLGGVELGQMFGVVCLCAVTALFAAAVGLFFSTFMNRAYAVILLSYAAMMLLYGFVPFVVVTLLLRGSGSNNMWLERLVERLMAMFHPFFSVAMLAGGRGFFIRTDWWPCVLVHLGMTALLVLCSALVLRRIARRAGERPSAIDPSADIPLATPAMASVAPRTDGTPPPLPVPPILDYTAARNKPAKYVAQRSVSDRPVLWREIHRPLMTKRWQSLVGAIACVLLLVISYASLGARDLGDRDVQVGFAFIFCGLTMLLVAVLAGTAIAQEKESDTWTLLLATPLGAGSIVWGKVIGLMRRMLWPSILIVGHFVVFTVADVISVTSLGVILWVIFTFNTIWIATGVYLSLRLKRVTFAVILNLVLPVLAYLGVLAVSFILGELLAERDDWGEWVGLYAPYTYLLEGINAFSRHGYNYSYTNPVRPWLAVFGRVSEGGFLWAVFWAGFGHLLLSGLIVLYTIGEFDRIVGRARELPVTGTRGFEVLPRAAG